MKSLPPQPLPTPDTAAPASRWQARQVALAAGMVCQDLGRGLWSLAHNALLLTGVAVVASTLYVWKTPDLRERLQTQALSYLEKQAAQAELAQKNIQSNEGLNSAASTARLEADPTAIVRVSATLPTTQSSSLGPQKYRLTQWLSDRYRVAPEAVASVVKEAWHIGQKTQVDPLLILSVVSIESRFNPYAHSHVGAQGLMQVMTEIHRDKYRNFGGNLAALDPLSNLHVGVQVLKECVTKAGSVQRGLRFYVGAANLGSDGGYAAKVLGERENLRRVVKGVDLPATAPIVPASLEVQQNANLQADAGLEPMPKSATASTVAPVAGKQVRSSPAPTPGTDTPSDNLPLDKIALVAYKP